MKEIIEFFFPNLNEEISLKHLALIDELVKHRINFEISKKGTLTNIRDELDKIELSKNK